MKNLIFLIMALSLVFTCVLCVNAGEKKTDTVSGVLKVQEDADENIKSAVITVDSKKYKVVLDEKGKELAKNCANKEVIVTGTVKGKGKKFTITVTSYNIKEDVIKKKTTEGE